MQGVWLVGGSDLEAIQVAAKFPELGQHNLVLLKVDDLSANYQRNFKEPKGFPSTGFIGTSPLSWFPAYHCDTLVQRSIP